MGDRKVRMGWEFYPNPARATLDCDCLLPETGTELFMVSNETDAGKALREAVMGIHGIEEMHSKGYSLSVKRGGVFTWEEVCGRVESVLCDFLGSEKVTVPVSAGI